MNRTLAILAVLFLIANLVTGEEPTRPNPARLPPAAQRLIDFRQEVQPILTKACVSCHGPEKQRGGLRLDHADAARKGGNSGVILKAGDAPGSRLLLVVAGLDSETKMPPESRKPLTIEEVSVLRAWIEQGAKWPKDGGSTASVVKSSHWAFQPVQRPELPAVKNAGWARNEIDRFILARLEQEGLQPSPEADPSTLVRRLYLDLVGLPPSPQEVDAFTKDTQPGAYERLAERVLASPHYGERWGRHWLDMARYADSDGFEKDTGRPHAWRFRHWVIEALNRDLPFDQFTVEQLAGDLLPAATVEQKAATGFHRNTLTNREGGVDREQFRVEQVMDRVNTTMKVWLGMTFGCCQCHDHKYDPLSQREYYEFLAFFNSDVEVDILAPVPDVDAANEAQRAAPQPSKAQTLALGPLRKTNIMIRGDFLRKGVEVSPGTPAVLPALPKINGKPPTRLEMARWITDPQNPLSGRVLVNWVWQRYFGRGLVATLEDFGTQGEKPSHPQLLDWLASEVVRRKWSLKEVHRLIVTSATYRQSSRVSPELLVRDPLNVLLAHQSRLRLEAEIVRDGSLAASGLLTRKIGGPSVRPPQPPGISELTYAGAAKWVESTGPDRYRRGMYTWFQRTSPYPMLITFDAPDSNVCVVRRERSNTPLQALTLLNETTFTECAQSLGRRIVTETPNGDLETRLRHAFRLCLAREPDARETSVLTRLYGDFLAEAKAKPAETAKLVGAVRPGTVKEPEAAAWVALARVLLNLDEFVTRE